MLPPSTASPHRPGAMMHLAGASTIIYPSAHSPQLLAQHEVMGKAISMGCSLSLEMGCSSHPLVLRGLAAEEQPNIESSTLYPDNAQHFTQFHPMQAAARCPRTGPWSSTDDLTTVVPSSSQP
jgi:hypothetical protein